MPDSAINQVANLVAAANFADKFLMVVLGLAIVVPTVFLVGAVLVSRKLEKEQDDQPEER